jgi:tight adherence protein C
MKLPVAILFSMLFFIFPVLFIAILGPAVINAIATFSGQ